MELEPLDVGSTSYIFPTSYGVVKRTHRSQRRASIKSTAAKPLSPLEERAIHSLCETILNHPFYTRLKTPQLSPDTRHYEMERIDTSRFCTLGETSTVVQEEFQTLQCEMELKGVVLIDTELFEQDDGTFMILDFNRCVVSNVLPAIVAQGAS